ncbi:MAG: sialidase family protein [Armatimonadota bacterium]
MELHNGWILAARTVPVSTGGFEVQCHRSLDGGLQWGYLSRVACNVAKGADIGDGHMIQLRDGSLLYSYRDNLCHGDIPISERQFWLRVAQSRDNGLSWSHHSEVTSSRGTEAGLWSTFLLQRRDGTLQCYFDDEVTPSTQGFPRHQWLTMRSWDPVLCSWMNPVTVSRAHNPIHLSRDGMCSVVEMPSKRLICAFEGVQNFAPHRGLLRYTTSDDGGKSWSWQRHERSTLYEPSDRNFNVTAPWMIRLESGALLCVFTTDEDRPAPGVISTGRLEMNLKCVLSFDDGRSWQSRAQTVDSRFPLYFPGVTQLRYSKNRGSLLVQYEKQGEGSLVKLGREEQGARRK